MWDTIWINAHIATMKQSNDYSIIENGAIAVTKNKISWIGLESDLTDTPNKLAKTVVDVQGKWITPGLVDCHTHLIYGGNRALEFEQRLNGVSYQDISKSGGGILSTVRATRTESHDTLKQSAYTRLNRLRSEGVTTFEIKSGYGLDIETEAKMLRIATEIRNETGLRIQRTFLGAHAIPPEFKGRSDDYIDFICSDMLPALQAENLIDAVDAFGENIGFSPEQVRRVFDVAKSFNLPVKLHADQLSDQNGGGIAAEYHALSADHLEYTTEQSVQRMKDNNTVAVLLPAAFYFLKEVQKPPIDLFRKYNIPMAIATDCNPGSAPATSILLMLNMACTLFGLTPAEALSAITKHAVQALGYLEDCGTLEKNKYADFIIWNINHPSELCYHIGLNPIDSIVQNGIEKSAF